MAFEGCERQGPDRQRERTLVFFPGALGDAVCLEPAVRWLAQRGPVTLYARGNALEVAALFPVDLERRSLDRPEVARLFAPMDEAPEEAPSLLVPFAHIVSFTGAGCDAFRQRLEGTGRALVLPFPSRDGDAHVVRELFAAATSEPVVDMPPEALLPRLVRPRSTAPPAGRDPRPLLALHPGSGGPAKRAPKDVFRELAARWRLQAGRVLVLLGPAEEREEAGWDGLVDDIERPVNIQRLACAIADADAYLGNDAGPSHVAAALGCPATVLHVATDPRRWGARGPDVCHVIVGPDGEHGLIERAWRALRRDSPLLPELPQPPSTGRKRHPLVRRALP